MHRERRQATTRREERSGKERSMITHLHAAQLGGARQLVRWQRVELWEGRVHACVEREAEMETQSTADAMYDALVLQVGRPDRTGYAQDDARPWKHLVPLGCARLATTSSAAAVYVSPVDAPCTRWRWSPLRARTREKTRAVKREKTRAGATIERGEQSRARREREERSETREERSEARGCRAREACRDIQDACMRGEARAYRRE